MNERIKELMEQCRYSEFETEYDMEKFAELIVRECIDTIQNESMNSKDEWEDGLRIAEGAIREHFGVEL